METSPSPTTSATLTTEVLSAAEEAKRTRHPIKKLYFWTLHWAETRYALPALFILSFLESSVFPIPPDVLLMAMVFGNRERWMTYAFWCTIGSVMGAVLGWYMGWGFWAVTQDFFYNIIPGFTAEKFAKVEQLYQDNATAAILAAAFTPIPYKVFTVAAGVCHVAIPVLVGASLIGRGARFFLVAGLIRFAGPKIKPFMEKHFDLATILFLLMAIAGFAALKLLH
ncbi:MAG: VTT domain-containing protein [Verrucomicrobiia bacterium]